MNRTAAEDAGNFLFRYRSALPFVAACVLPLALRQFQYPYGSHQLDLLWELACLTVSLLGLGIRIWTSGFAPKGTSGRNTSGQKAEQLNTTGPYSVVRHPLYVGNALIWLGIAMFPRQAWAVAVVMVLFAVFHRLIVVAEEGFLRRKFGAEFEEWASRTPPFLPRFRNWRKPALPFSVRTVLKREHTSFFSVMVAFTILETAGDYFALGRLGPDLFWWIVFGLSLTVYVVLRTLKKKTTVLDVPGR